MNETKEIGVGDAYLFVESVDKEFKTCKVSKVTKATFTITLADGTTKGPFAKVTSWGPSPLNQGHEYYKSSRYGGERHYRVYPDEPDIRMELIGRRAEELARREAKRQEEEAKRLRWQEEQARKMEEAMDALGCHAGMPLKHMRSLETMPDGSRVYTIMLPVKPERAEQKKGWELVIIRCWDVEECDWDCPRDENGERRMVKRTEMAYTYTNGGCHSFSSVSTSKHKDDERAVWDAICDQYHRW